MAPPFQPASPCVPLCPPTFGGCVPPPYRGDAPDARSASPLEKGDAERGTQTIRRRRTSTTHPDHTKVTDRDRLAAVVMLRTRQWTRTAIAEQLGVSRKTVARIGARYGR